MYLKNHRHLTRQIWVFRILFNKDYDQIRILDNIDYTLYTQNTEMEKTSDKLKYNFSEK